MSGSSSSVAHVRAAGAADVPAVLALWARSRSAAASTPDTAEGLHRLLATGPGSLIVAEEGPGGAIVGVLVAAWDGWRGNMYRLAVDEAYRRRGVATALVRAGEEHLRALGGGRITVLVAHEEDEAVALWEAVGYRNDTAIARFVRDLE